MNRIFSAILLVALIAYSTLALGSPTLAATTNSQLFQICKSGSTAANSAVCKDIGSGTSTNPVNKVIKTATEIIAIATGVAAVVYIILGGITMITSSGNAEAVANARKRIIYAVIGLIIVALAWTTISFVTDRLLK